MHVKGILGGTEEAGRHIGYLTKYLSKSIGQAAGLTEHATDAQRDHARRLHAELRITPCSPRCPIWLLYGIQPQGALHSITPGRCKGKAHQPQHLGIAGRRVLVSRKWSNKTLDDHRAELNGQPAAQELTRHDIETMIDSIEDISAALAEAEPQRLTALYDALRLQMVYDPDSRVLDVTVQPRGRVNSARVRGAT